MQHGAAESQPTPQRNRETGRQGDRETERQRQREGARAWRVVRDGEALRVPGLVAALTRHTLEPQRAARSTAARAPATADPGRGCASCTGTVEWADGDDAEFETHAVVGGVLANSVALSLELFSVVAGGVVGGVDGAMWVALWVVLTVRCSGVDQTLMRPEQHTRGAGRATRTRGVSARRDLSFAKGATRDESVGQSMVTLTSVWRCHCHSVAPTTALAKRPQ